MKKKSRIETEKITITHMIHIYCRGNKHQPVLCPECEALLKYAHFRLDKCRFGEEKTYCEKCPVHCYKPDMRKKVKEVMRYSGPRMLIYHPIAAIKHMLHI